MCLPGPLHFDIVYMAHALQGNLSVSGPTPTPYYGLSSISQEHSCVDAG